MKNTEKHIESIAGKGNPFRVPEGYFDDFHSRVMSSLPEQKTTVIPIDNAGKRNRWRIAAGIAACLFAAIGGTTIYMSKIDSNDMLSQQTNTTDGVEQTVSTMSYEDEMTEYAMIDNLDIYAYLADE